jgi:hypothetical protein
MSGHRVAIEQLLQAEPHLTRAQVAARLGTTPDGVKKPYAAARKKLGLASEPGRGGASPDLVQRVEEIVQEFQDNAGVITSKSPTVRTVEALLEAAQVDLAVWEVERTVVNQWQTARKDRDMKMVYEGGKASGYIHDRGGMDVTPLWQVKVWLRRRTPQETSLAALLDTLRERAPLLPTIKRPKLRKSAARRALEVDIMDPHLGLLCGMPEADAPWDLDLAAGHIMAALEDLIAKAEPFGPFEQVFLPFGNDFQHSDTVFHTTTAGTGQPEAISWHRVYVYAEQVAIRMLERLRQVAPVWVYEIPGNHSRMADFTLARLLAAYFRTCGDVSVDASASPYKFHRFGVNLIGFEHGHSVAQIRLASLMANERPKDFAETRYREWHLGDQHRKGSSNPAALEEQGVSVEFIPGLTAPNEWHRLKAFNHQQRGALAFVWDFHTGPVARLAHNILRYAGEAASDKAA